MSDNSTNLSSFSDNVKKGVDSRLKDLHTALPGIVESFDSVTQLASIQPAIRRIFVRDDGESVTLTPTDLPLLINVPVVFPRGGGFSLTFPVKAGDECLLVFSERSIDAWHDKGEVSTPIARRFHDLSDAIAFVGLSSNPKKIPNYDPDNLTLKKDDDSSHIKIKDDEDIEIISNGDIIAECENITVDATATAIVTCPESTFNGNVSVNGNLTVSGIASAPTVNAGTSLTVASKEMSGHTHAQGNDSDGNSEQDTGPPV